MNRAERKRLATHARLIDAVRELLADSSVDGLVGHDVTERADVALGTFYNHFEDKLSAVRVVADMESESGRRMIASMLPREQMTRARAAALAVTALVQQHQVEPKAMASLSALYDARVLPDAATLEQAQELLRRSDGAEAPTIAWRLAAFRGVIAALIGHLAEGESVLTPEAQIDAGVRSVLGAAGATAEEIDDAVEVALSIPMMWSRTPTIELVSSDEPLPTPASA